MVKLRFHAGTLELLDTPPGVELPAQFVRDERTRSYRAPAYLYAPLMRALHKVGIEPEDAARGYTELTTPLVLRREPRDYQLEALEAFKAAKGRGVVVLPTGAGKTWVGVMAIEHYRRSTLVIAPTLDLVRQWYDLLRTSFRCEVGIVGGGSNELRPITVTTYDSAHLHMEYFGSRFGLVIFDEAHHLPGESYAHAARACIAPYRLGLTATPERADGKEALLDELIGPIVYRKDIAELSGTFLADYDVVRVTVELAEAERAEYEAERAIYTAFLRAQGIRMSTGSGWSDFVKRSARSPAGRRAMGAYRRQRDIAFAAPAKLDYLETLFNRHRQERLIVFSVDNATAYDVSRRFLVPVITHQTKVKERSEILERFSSGVYMAVSTSKVLNEGVDVPDAAVAVILSGSGSVREHVQRLGRILRPRDGKRAVLYELVSAGTSEKYTSDRRRDHEAYRP